MNYLALARLRNFNDRRTNMLLTLTEAGLFFKLHRSLMVYVNERLEVVPSAAGGTEGFAALSPETRLEVRNAFLKHPGLLESFVEENPACLYDDELAIVASWRNLVVGKFFILRELKKYTVFLLGGSDPIAYGVLALSQPFEELIGPQLPYFAETVLLPFNDKIIYDGLMSGYGISFGAGIRRSLNEEYNQAKARYGIVTSLPIPSDARPVPARKPKAKSPPNASPKAESADVLKNIVAMIDEFCHQHLNEEYAVVCGRLAEKLARKRPSPLLRGSPNSWAAGIVRAAGWVNFLHDKSQSPYMPASDIDSHFGVSESSSTARTRAIRTMFGICQLDPDWTLPSKIDDNPLIWTLKINGFIVDVRNAPRDVQETAYEKGLIPYIPVDRRKV
jgi:hypothetical protein